MGLGNYFFYKSMNRATKMTQQEKQQAVTVRKAIFNQLNQNATNPVQEIQQQKNVALTEIPDIAAIAGDHGSTASIFSKYINAMDATKKERLKAYREMAKYPDISFAIDEYVNEAINFSSGKEPINLVIKNKAIDSNDSMRQTLFAEWNFVMNDLMQASDHIDAWFRDFMVDGEIFFEKVFDNDRPEIGLTRTKRIMTSLISPIYGDLEAEEVLYYAYIQRNGTEVANLPKELIAYANSGLFEYSLDEQEMLVNSFLEVAKTTYRRLKLLEDALVIYRLVRSPERRVFNIDVGNLPKARAEQYLKETILKHRQRKSFDPSTGDISESLDPIAMTEDYYFPVFAGGRQSKIETLPGGQHLDEIADVDYFLKKLWRSLKIPLGRFGEEKKVQFGEGGEIDHDELKFVKDVKKFSRRFGKVFKEIFLTHLKLKGITEEYGITTEDIEVEMLNNNLIEKFLDAKNQELKFSVFEKFKDLIDTENKPFSQEWVIKKYLEIPTEEWVENMKLRNVERVAAKAQEKEDENGESSGGGGGSLGGGTDSSSETPPADDTGSSDATPTDTSTEPG